MNKFVTTALALGAVGTVGWADPGDNEWLELDSEIESLASSLSPAQDGMGWSGLIRATWTYSSDDVATGGIGQPDINGFKFEDVWLSFWGSVAEYGWRISLDLAGTALGASSQQVLLDAYAFWDCSEYFTATFGQFTPRGLRSGFIDPENQLFIDRTALGSTFNWWDVGIQAEGYYEQFGWSFSIQNQGPGNGDGAGQERSHYYVLRVEYNHGAGAGAAEGALGGTDELNLTAAFVYTHSDVGGTGTGFSLDANDKQNVYALEVNGNYSSFGFGVEVALLDDGAFMNTHGDYSRIDDHLIFVGDSTPFNFTASYLVTPEWEVAVRWEFLDNGDMVEVPNSGMPPVMVNGPDNDVLSVAVVWYRSGRNAKWTAQWSYFNASNNADLGFFNRNDGSVVQIGLTVGATR